MVRLKAVSSIYIVNFDVHQVKDFKTRLKAAKYHGSYFDRSSEKEAKICDDTGKPALKWQSEIALPAGLFHCEGKYNSAQCCYPKERSINPYQSSEVMQYI